MSYCTSPVLKNNRIYLIRNKKFKQTVNFRHLTYVPPSGYS